MSIDWATDMLDPIYDAIGVTARVENASLVKDITIIDKTAGVSVSFGDVNVQSMVPAAVVRMSELTEKNISRASLDGAKITFNSQVWTIKSSKPLPTPGGEGAGELMLFLKEPA